MYRTRDNKKVSLARKRLYELSLKTIGVVPRLEDPNEEQAEWTKNRMKSRRWDK